MKKKVIIEPFMIELVKQIYYMGKPLTYSEQAKYLNMEFAMNYTEEDVRMYYEPTISEEIEDLKLIYERTIA